MFILIDKILTNGIMSDGILTDQNGFELWIYGVLTAVGFD